MRQQHLDGFCGLACHGQGHRFLGDDTDALIAGAHSRLVGWVACGGIGQQVGQAVAGAKTQGDGVHPFICHFQRQFGPANFADEREEVARRLDVELG